MIAVNPPSSTRRVGIRGRWPCIDKAQVTSSLVSSIIRWRMSTGRSVGQCRLRPDFPVMSSPSTLPASCPDHIASPRPCPLPPLVSPPPPSGSSPQSGRQGGEGAWCLLRHRQRDYTPHSSRASLLSRGDTQSNENRVGRGALTPRSPTGGGRGTGGEGRRARGKGVCPPPRHMGRARRRPAMGTAEARLGQTGAGRHGGCGGCYNVGLHRLGAVGGPARVRVAL